MKTTVSLQAVSCGTELSIVQESIPELSPSNPAISAGRNSLVRLAKLVKAEIRE